MKRRDSLSHLKSLSLADIRKEVAQVERQLQEHHMALAFGKTKQVSTGRNLKRQLARTLTIANQKLRETVTE